MPSRLNAVLFDFDDTLIDWSGVALGWREIEAARLSSVLNYLNGRSGHSQIHLENLIDEYTSRTRAAWSRARMNLRAPVMPEILLRTLSDMGLNEAEHMADEIMAAYDWQAVPGTVVFPDVPPMLQMLQDNGVKAGIVTNASQPMWLRDAELRQHGLIDYFCDCRLAAADVGYLKPHWRIFRAALDKIGAPAEETVFVGDNPVADVAGAQAVGMKAVLRVNPDSIGQDHLAKPQAQLSTFAELPAILDGWYPGWRRDG